jgi:hypothetical protein
MLPESNLKEERNWTPSERMKYWRERGHQVDAGATWHPVDERMTRVQHIEIPDGGPHPARSVELWLKFRHPARIRDIVVARGFFDFESGTWTARLQPDENAGHHGHVRPESWAPIVAGEPPPGWIGEMIQRMRNA